MALLIIGTLGLVAVPAATAAVASSPTPAACRYGVWPASVSGRPASLAPGAATGLYLWHSDDGWQAYVTHPGSDPVVFRVRVASSGSVYGVEVRTERGDDVRVSHSRSVVSLRAVNFGHLDGMAFRTSCGRGIAVSGTVDGRPLRTSEVFLGSSGGHPTSVPFTVERQR